MGATTERVFVLGGTGNIGTKVVKDLIAKDIHVTLYSRNPSKAMELFSNNPNVSTVEGDFSDLTPLEEGMKGHTRLFLLYNNFSNFAETKAYIAKLAYQVGIKQVVDISSRSVHQPWRMNFIGTNNMAAEKAISEIPNRGAFVALRPGRFMSNLFITDRPSPEGLIVDTADEDTRQGWISPNDIGAVAAIVLSEPIEKHADCVYDMIGDSITPIERAAAASRALGRSIKYQKISAVTKYNNLMKIGLVPHAGAYSLATVDTAAAVTPGISILLGREPETLEHYMILNKAEFA